MNESRSDQLSGPEIESNWNICFKTRILNCNNNNKMKTWKSTQGFSNYTRKARGNLESLSFTVMYRTTEVYLSVLLPVVSNIILHRKRYCTLLWILNYEFQAQFKTGAAFASRKTNSKYNTGVFRVILNWKAAGLPSKGRQTIIILIVRIRLSQYWKKIDSSLSQSLYKIWDLSAIILWNETCLSTEISMKKCYNLPIFLPQMIFYSPAKLNVKKINKRKRSSLAERWIIMTKDWKIRRMTSFLWTAENKINLHCNSIYERQPISLMVIYNE